MGAYSGERWLPHCRRPGRKSYGHVPTLDEAKAAFKAEYLARDPMTDDERRLLDLLAASDDAATDALLTTNGFMVELVVGLVRVGLATSTAEQTFAAGHAINFTRVRITDAGRRALAERRE